MPTLSANGDTDVYDVMGSVHIHCSGTFGSGTIAWYFKGSDQQWHPLAEGSSTSAIDKRFDFPEDIATRIKGTLSGATAPSLYYEARAHKIYVAE